MTPWRYWLVVILTAVVICTGFAGVRALFPPTSKIIPLPPRSSMHAILWEAPNTWAIITIKKDGRREMEIIGP